MSESPQPHDADRGVPRLASAGALPETSAVRFVTLVLAMVAAFVDAVGFLTLFGLFTAHMSGNTTRLGVALGDADWTEVLTRFFPIPVFVLSVAIGAFALAWMSRRSVRTSNARLLGAQTVTIAAVMLGGRVLIDVGELEQNSLAFFVVAGLLVAALGLQTAVLRHVGGLSVHTTFVTGMLTQFAVHTVDFMLDARARRQRRVRQLTESERENRRAMLLAGGIWVCYVIGATAGALLFSVWELWALFVPVIVLVLVTTWELRGAPTTVGDASVRE